jgi:pimeloyl-ACP methyl ester carboxylesterase
MRAIGSRSTVAALVLALVAVACGGDADPGRGRAADRSTLDWERCGAVECATLTVPLDHDRPDGPAIDLALARRRAGDPDRRAGTLVVNPGGPGAPGIPLVQQASLVFTDVVLERFDIVAWDPRGTGASTPVDCLDDLDAFFAVDRSPDTAEERAANERVASELAQGCAQRSGPLLPYLGTRDTVDDLELVRVALGEDRLTYLGFSYGSLVGARYADRYPDRVRAMVLDGGVDPAASAEEVAIAQATGFDAALDAFFEYCADGRCRFGGRDPHGAFVRLMALIDAETLPAIVGGEERELGPGEADLAVANALYAGRDGWDLLADALRAAAQGDGSDLLALADAYTGRQPGGAYTNAQEALYAIGCLDQPAPPDPQAIHALAADLAAAAPVFGAPTAYLGLPCAFWPVPALEAPAAVRGAGAGPVLVVGTTNDPATPLAWAEALATQLESAALLVAQEEGHTAYGRGIECVDGAVEAVLLDARLPADGTRCRA